MTANKSSYDLIVGLGRSGLSMARFLAAQGRRVMATDIDPARSGAAKALEDAGIQTQVGFHDPEVFAGAERIIPSPGIPLTIPFIRDAAAKGVRITGELDIFSQYSTTPVIAVTGTNGKTTTTTLIGKMLKTCGLSCFVGGNIGTPLVDHLMAGTRVDWVVAEVSSFQLDLAKDFCPKIGLLLNISEDHLDRYPSFKAYAASKWSMFARQTPDHTAVVNLDMEGTKALLPAVKASTLGFSSKETPGARARVADTGITIRTGSMDLDIPSDQMENLPGVHNRENIAAAALAVLVAGGTPEGILTTLQNFTPLAHRMNFVREVDGIRFYNDSKATNVDAVIRALESFKNEIILILGGREKDTDFTPLIRAVRPSVKQILAIGEATGHIMETFEKTCQVIPCKTMAQAVGTGRKAAVQGDVVLLSPACASFDMYENYEARGRDFMDAVQALKPKKEAANE